MNVPLPEEAATIAAGSSEPIVFRTEPLPLNEARVGGEFLPLRDALLQAMKNNAGIQAALSRVRRYQAEARQARLLQNPIISVSLRYPESRSRPIIEAGLAQDLLSLVQKPGLISAADNRLRASGAEAVSAVLDVVAELQSQYSRVQTLDMLVAELEERKSLVARLLEVTRARLEAGEGTRLDVTTADTQRIEIEAEYANTELERRQERVSLARMIGQPSGDGNWKVSPWAPSFPVRNTESHLVAAALEHRPEIQAKHWELSARGAERRLSWLAPLAGFGAGAEAEREEEWSVGPSVTSPIPIFDFGQARRDAARAAVLEAQHELVQAKRQVIEEVRRAHAAHLSTATILIKVQRELIPLAEQRLEQAQMLYEVGETDLTTLFLAEQDLHETHARELDLQQKSTLSLIQLERAIGGPGVVSQLYQSAGESASGGAEGNIDPDGNHNTVGRTDSGDR